MPGRELNFPGPGSLIANSQSQRFAICGADRKTSGQVEFTAQFPVWGCPIVHISQSYLQPPVCHPSHYIMLSLFIWVFVFVFVWSDHGSRGWYDNSQPVLRPAFIVAQCATPCVQSVCMPEWCSATVVATVHALCLRAAVLLVPSPSCKFL